MTDSVLNTDQPGVVPGGVAPPPTWNVTDVLSLTGELATAIDRYTNDGDTRRALLAQVDLVRDLVNKGLPSEARGALLALKAHVQALPLGMLGRDLAGLSPSAGAGEGSA